jgi:5-methylcytosine-specific restriction endonuclease McrA
MTLKNAHGACDQCQKQRDSTPEAQAYRREWYKKNLEDQRRKARERMAKLLQDPEYAQIHRERSRKCNAKNRAANGRTSSTGLHFPPHLLGHGLRSAELQAFLDAGIQIEDVTKDDVLANRQMQQALQRLTPPPSVARLVMDEQKRYWRENPEAKKRHDSQWDKHKYALRYKCDPSFRRHECQRNSEKKARNRGNHTVKLCRGDIDARFAEFGDRCAFCGSADRLTLEHVVARSKGGPHAIGNILPSCYRCNMSKTSHDAETWYRAQPFFTEARWRKICRVLEWKRSSVGQLALL